MSGWIKVEDGLPNPHMLCVIKFSNGPVELAYINGDGKWEMVADTFLSYYTEEEYGVSHYFQIPPIKE